jgi:glutaminyl-peptide cyclotransferase
MQFIFAKHASRESEVTAPNSSKASNKKTARMRKPPSRLPLIILFTVIVIGGVVYSGYRKRPVFQVTFDYKVVNQFPHDPLAFSQGLVVDQGVMYESTGRVGQSSIRIVDMQTGTVKKSVALKPEDFGEGITILGNKLYQLTWRNGRVYIYDKELNLLEEKKLRGDGWGLTTDGRELIMSNGSSVISFLDPNTLETTRTIEVKRDGFRQDDINELEFVDGNILANVFHEDVILQIDPASGLVKGVIDLSGLFPPQERPEYEAVLNGIAFDSTNRKIYVTGKLWPKIFEIEVFPRGPAQPER